MIASYLLLLAALGAYSTPLHPTFTSCLSSYLPNAQLAEQLVVTDIYANLVPKEQAAVQGLTGGGKHNVLRVDLFGTTQSVLQGFNNETEKLATLFTDTTEDGLNVYTTTSWVCYSLSSPNVSECPLPAGPFAINLSIPLYRSSSLTTLRTQIRVVDTSASVNTLACIDVNFTPFTKTEWYYSLFRFVPVALAIGFWAATWSARFAAGWVIGSGVAEYDAKEGGFRQEAGARRDARMRKWGTMLVSGLSGERLSVSGGLLRFITPGLRDIMYHIQWVTVLAMIAVAWPEVVYPILSTGAWTDLVGNITLVQGSDPAGKHIAPYPNNFTPPDAWSSEISNPSSQVYLDSTMFNPLLDLQDSANGMQSFAASRGLREQDLFGTCMILFLALAAGIVVLSLFAWLLHSSGELFSTASERFQSNRTSTGSTPRHSWGTKEAYNRDSHGGSSTDILKLQTQASSFSVNPRKASKMSRLRRTWFRFRPRGEAGAFHMAALYGNLLRLILLFHLPITAFSIYQLSIGSHASIVSRVFAALTFVFISVVIPAVIMWKVYKTPSGKLYDATRTLLSIGPVYNVYVEGKQMFRVFSITASLVTGIVVGAGQHSGLAQAVILVVVELLMLIVPAIWYPWGEGASMGAPSAFVGIVRVITLVLVMLLSPILGLGNTTQVWLANVILLLQAIVFVFFLFMLLTKIVEGFIRLSGGVHFDESTHPLDGGLFAAIMDLDCLNGVMGGKAAARRRRKHGSKQLQRNVSAVGSLTTQMMLDRHSQGVPRETVQEGSTPFISSYPTVRDPDGYFPSFQPPLGPPPPERHSFESRSDEPSNTGHIMDAWRPPPPSQSYAPPGSYVPSATSPTIEAGSSNQPTGNSFDVRSSTNPYDPHAVRRTSTERPLSPPSIRMSGGEPQSIQTHHARHQSWSATVEPSQSPPMATVAVMPTSPSLYPPGHPLGVRPNAEGLRPAQIAIPKRRSLNNLKEEDTPESAHSDATKGRKAKYSSKPSTWFAKVPTKAQLPSPGAESPGESDDEPGPSRRNMRRGTGPMSPLSEAGPGSGHARGGWRSVLGLGRKRSVDDLGDLSRDENKARKAALAAESGSLFAGVNAPTPPAASKGFVVSRKGGPSPSVSRTGLATSDAPLSNHILASSAPPAGGNTPEPRSFKVKRMGQPTPAPLAVPLITTFARTAAPQDASGSTSVPPTTAPPGRSFKVLRRDNPPSPMGFVVDRAPPNSPKVQSRSSDPPRLSTNSTGSGYEPSAFVPLR